MNVLLATLLVLILASHARAATYYVSPTGDNGRSCATATNSATPLQTIWEATHVKSCLAPGDTLQLLSGTYTEDWSLNPPVSGTSWDASGMIRITGEGQTVIIQPSSFDASVFGLSGNKQYWQIDNIKIDGSNGGQNSTAISTTWISDSSTMPRNLRLWNIEVTGFFNSFVYAFAQGNQSQLGGFANFSTNIHIKGWHVHDNGGDRAGHGEAIYIQASDNIVEDNVIENNGWGGIALYNNAPNFANRNVIRNNRVINNSDNAHAGACSDGITVSAGNDNIIRNNVIARHKGTGVESGFTEGCTGIGIYTQSPSRNAVFNNTVTGAVNYGVRIYVQAVDTVLKNNIVYDNCKNAPSVSGETCADIVNSSGSTVQSNNLTTNPTFTNAAGDDYTLAGGSAAIDAGTDSIAAGISFGPYNGSAPEIGYWESGTGGGAPRTGTVLVSATLLKPIVAMLCTVDIADSGNVKDWVGIFPVGASGSGFLTWKYLSNSQTEPGAAVTDPVALTFTAPAAAGPYECRLYANDSIFPEDLLDTDTFSVTIRSLVTMVIVQ